jgi:hypothetical protein
LPRSHTTSEKGKIILETARKEKRLLKTFDDRWQEEYNKALSELEGKNISNEQISDSTLKRFFNGSESVGERIYMALCKVLGVNIKDVVKSKPLPPHPFLASQLDEESYRKSLLKAYAYLKLDLLDPSAYEYEIKTSNIFVPPDVRETFRRNGELIESPVRSVIDLLDDPQFRYGVFLGDPGSGKSTLLKFLALEWSEEKRDEIPLLVELRRYAQECMSTNQAPTLSLLEYLSYGNSVILRLEKEALKQKMETEPVLVMFDGLDEVFDKVQRNNIVQQIIRISNEVEASNNNKIKILVTSRKIGYMADELRHAEFRHFSLENLTDELVYEFIDLWHQLSFGENKEEKEKLQKRLLNSINDSRSIKELTGNPLLLTMLAILNRTHILPRDRIHLYQKISEILLEHWEIERGIPQRTGLPREIIGLEEKHAILREVAYFIQSSGSLISEEDLKKLLQEKMESLDEVEKPIAVSRLIIEQLKERIFILCCAGCDPQKRERGERDHQVFSFVHRTFLEYFCACHFLWQFKEEQSIDIEDLKTELFAKHWEDESWHEVMKLVTGSLQSKFSAEIIDFLLKIHTHFPKSKKAEKSKDKDDWAHLLLATDCLAEVKQRKEIHLIVDEVMKQIREKIENPSQYKLSSESASALIRATCKAFKSDKDIPNWLKSCTQIYTDVKVRQTIIQELIRGWKYDPETIRWLKEQAHSDRSHYVRQTAAQELIRSFGNGQNTLDIIRDIASSSELIPTLYKPARSNAEYDFVTDSREIKRFVRTNRQSLISTLNLWIENNSHRNVKFLASDFIGKFQINEFKQRLLDIAEPKIHNWDQIDINDRDWVLNYYWAASRCDTPTYDRLGQLLINTENIYIQEWILFVPLQMPDKEFISIIDKYLNKQKNITPKCLSFILQGLDKIKDNGHSTAEIFSRYNKILSNP